MLNRRRFLAIAASSLAASAAGASASVPGTVPVTVWKGTALGAVASLSLVHPDRALAKSLIGRCVDEIDRLESVFSLYRRSSALSRLNANGELHAPPAELLELMSFALALSRASGGAFDPSVQPLFRLYADHFAAHPAASGGPDAKAVARALESVGHRAIELRAERIRFHRPGMAVTLNGIAQGFITDQIAQLLRGAGFDRVLIDLGEAFALGRRPDGQPWRAAVVDPLHPQRTLFDLVLGDEPGSLPALATSGGYGSRFGPATHLHHLLDPRSGSSAEHYASVSVAAPRATLADGLSTALSILPPAEAGTLLLAYPAARAWFVDQGAALT